MNLKANKVNTNFCDAGYDTVANLPGGGQEAMVYWLNREKDKIRTYLKQSGRRDSIWQPFINSSTLYSSPFDASPCKDATINLFYNQEGYFSFSIPKVYVATSESGEQEYASSKWREYSGIMPEGTETLLQFIHPDDRRQITGIWTKRREKGDLSKTEARLKTQHGEYRWHSVYRKSIKNSHNEITQWDLINRMQLASLRMETLIDDLLAFSKVSSVKHVHTAVDLNILIEDVLNDLETTIKDKKASVLVDDLSPIQGNELQLRQLFQNLISNSLKFSKADQPPMITVSSTIVSGREINSVSFEDRDKIFQLLELKDNGIGFEPQYAEKIFEIFQRLHGRTEYAGSGIGLSIVRKVIENHNGYIIAEGEPGIGATFKIFLPAYMP